MFMGLGVAGLKLCLRAIFLKQARSTPSQENGTRKLIDPLPNPGCGMRCLNDKLDLLRLGLEPNSMIQVQHSCFRMFPPLQLQQG